MAPQSRMMALVSLLLVSGMTAQGPHAVAAEHVATEAAVEVGAIPNKFSIPIRTSKLPSNFHSLIPTFSHSIQIPSLGLVSIKPYPGFNGTNGTWNVTGGAVISSAGPHSIAVKAALMGIPPYSNGTWHIHEGTTCAQVGGHYFPNDLKDPWTSTIWTSNTFNLSAINFSALNHSNHTLPVINVTDLEQKLAEVMARLLDSDLAKRFNITAADLADFGFNLSDFNFSNQFNLSDFFHNNNSNNSLMTFGFINETSFDHLSVEQSFGHALVIHAADGTPVGCGIIESLASLIGGTSPSPRRSPSQRLSASPRQTTSRSASAHRSASPRPSASPRRSLSPRRSASRSASPRPLPRRHAAAAETVAMEAAVGVGAAASPSFDVLVAPLVPAVTPSTFTLYFSSTRALKGNADPSVADRFQVQADQTLFKDFMWESIPLYSASGSLLCQGQYITNWMSMVVALGAGCTIPKQTVIMAQLPASHLLPNPAAGTIVTLDCLIDGLYPSVKYTTAYPPYTPTLAVKVNPITPTVIPTTYDISFSSANAMVGNADPNAANQVVISADQTVFGNSAWAAIPLYSAFGSLLCQGQYIVSGRTIKVAPGAGCTIPKETVVQIQVPSASLAANPAACTVTLSATIDGYGRIVQYTTRTFPSYSPLKMGNRRVVVPESDAQPAVAGVNAPSAPSVWIVGASIAAVIMATIGLVVAFVRARGQTKAIEVAELEECLSIV